MLNSCIFMGRLTADPELRTTPNGVSVTTFTVAVDRPFQTAGEQRTADFFECVAWRTKAEFITKYFHKGTMICVQGYMTTRTYTDNKGISRKVYELVVENAHFTGEKRTTSEADQIRTPPPKPPVEKVSAAPAYSSGTYKDFQQCAIESDEDLPF